MARKKQTESASQPLTKWFSSQKPTPSSTQASSSTLDAARATGVTAPADPESTRKRIGANRRLGPTVSFGSSNLSSAPPSPTSSPVRRSSRVRASATPAPAQAKPRVYIWQPRARMPPSISHSPPVDQSPNEKSRRTSPPRWMRDEPASESSSESDEEIPSSQKDDDEPMAEVDLETLAAIPIYHMSSPPTSPSSDGVPTPIPATPPRLLSPDSKARHIVEEIRAQARLAVSSTSPPQPKRPHSPSDDSDSDDLPDADDIFGNKAPPSKRRASATPSPDKPRRSARKLKPPAPARTVIAPPKFKLQRNPFASIVREHAARAKRSESLPCASDGSHQDVFAIANAALMRDVDATFDDPGAETSGLVNADEAVNQLTEGGFAAEAEMVRRAGTASAEPNWTMFGPGVESKGDMLAIFPDNVAGLLQTSLAKRCWERVTNWVKAQDYDGLSRYLGSSMLPLAINAQEQLVIEPVAKWLVELVFLSPEHLALASRAESDLRSVIHHLTEDAQDRLSLHIARCLLRIGSPGNGVYVARQILGSSGDDVTFITSTKEYRSRLIELCASTLAFMTSTKAILPLLITLCLVGIDPSLDESSSLDIGKAAEKWACKAQSAQTQLEVCQTLVKTLSVLPLQQKRDIVREVFRGTRPATGHMSMWLAIAFLDDRGMDNVTPEIYAQRPPLARILTHVETLHITPSTHYPDLLATVQLLDIALWDVGALVEVERRAGRIVKYQAGVQPDSSIADVMYRLTEMHGRILDARATDLEKTRTKGVLQTLQVRLGWDLIEAARRGQQGATTIREMWGKPRPVRV